MTDTTFPALEEVNGKISHLNTSMAAVFTEAGPELDLSKVKCLGQGKTTFDVAAEVRKMNDELADLGRQRDDLTAVKNAAQRQRTPDDAAHREAAAAKGGLPRQREDNGEGRKTLGELFVESEAYKGIRNQNGPDVTLDIDLKTLMTEAAGFAPQAIRTGTIVPFITNPVQVVDLIPQTTTSMNAVVYMEETTLTNAAAETAEGGTYAESALAYTERTSSVRKVATFLPVTDEQLEDVPMIRGIIDNRLPFFLRQRLDTQLLTGDGNAPNLRGVSNVVGIQTQAKAADPTPDAVYKAMVKVMTLGLATPNAIIMNPTDWQGVRLLRTADGIYIWGNPSDTGPERMWGLTVSVVFSAAQGTAYVGDFANFSELSVRRGINTQVSNSHSTYFVEGKQALRADVRCAFVVYRPKAFCTVTGL